MFSRTSHVAYPQCEGILAKDLNAAIFAKEKLPKQRTPDLYRGGAYHPLKYGQAVLSGILTD